MNRNAWLPWGQWAAILAMTVEHVGRFVLPEAWGAAPWVTLVGRVALPLFAGMVAWHVVFNTRDPVRYARRLLVIAVVAQLPYMLAVGADKLNIVFSLAAGIVIASASWQRWRLLAAVTLLGVALVYPASFEYGLAGVLLVPAFVLALRCPYLVVLPLVVAWWCNGHWLFSLVASLSALIPLLVSHGALRITYYVKRVPRWLWLAWYPLHLALIGALVYVR